MTRLQLRPLSPFRHSVLRPAQMPAESSHVPAVDVRETEKVYTIEADLPGVRADSIEVTFEQGLLTLSAERAAADAAEDSRWLRRERNATRSSRSFRLPEEIDESAISAEYRDGVLRLTIPRSQSVSRRIPVSH